MWLIITSERRNASYVFWVVLTGVFALISMTTLLPEQWGVSSVFATAIVFLILDLILNFGILRHFLKNREDYSPSGKSWYVLLIIGLLLFDVSQVYLLTVTQNYIVIPTVLGIVVFVKYLLLKQETHLFWTTTMGIFLVMLFAMGLDIAIFKAASRPEEFIQNYFLKASFRNEVGIISTLSWVMAIGLVFAVWRFGSRLKKFIEGFSLSTDMLDEITYKSIAIGFPMFTVGGLLLGLIWAKGAWGRYWGWDPKETWSLITWLVYAIYLHARMIAGWRGKRLAVLAVVGFIAVIVTYLGVNLIIKIGLHAYGSG
jgi:cytochrome c-type biogenesis protein CcsB